MIFAGSLNTGPKIPMEARSLNTSVRAKTIFGQMVKALETAEGRGLNPNLTELQRSGMVAVARVNMAGKTKVYIGIKVPKGTMGDLGGMESFPTKEVGDWAIKNVLREGEAKLAGVTSTRTHAEGVIEDAIVRDAKALGIDPSTVEGTIGAAIDVCNGCQKNLSQSLPNVKPENPAP